MPAIVHFPVQSQGTTRVMPDCVQGQHGFKGVKEDNCEPYYLFSQVEIWQQKDNRQISPAS